MNLGSDPEVFVLDGKGGLLPAWRFLPNKRVGVQCEHPYISPFLQSPQTSRAGRAFWDGFQAEFSTVPQSCVAFLSDSIRAGLLTTLKRAKEIEPKARLTLQNVFQIPVSALRTESDAHVVLGCDPSFNAYYMSGEFPGDSRKLRYRFAGGHIHIEGVATEFSTGSSDYEKRAKLAIPFVQTLDKILGVWAVGAAASFDNPVRRKYYGLAGEYRLPKYGVEYRTLSNFWLAHSAIVNLVFELTRSITYAWLGQTGRTRSDLEKWVAHPQETVEAINNCDVKKARGLLKRNADVFKRIMPFGKEEALKVGMEGIESILRDPEDFESNWMLKEEEQAKWRLHSDGMNMNWKSASAAILTKEIRL